MFEYMKVTNQQIFKVLWAHIRRYRWMVFVVLVGSLVGQVTLNLIIPWYYKGFFDALVAGGENSTATLINVLKIIFALHLVSWVARRFLNITSNYFQGQVMADLAMTSERYLLRHSHQFFTNNFAGSLVRKVNRLSRAFENLADQTSYTLLPLVINVVGILVVLSIRSLTLGLALGVWLVITLTYNYYVARWKQRYDLLRAAKDSEATGVLADSITNNANIKLFNGYGHEEERYGRVTEDLRRLRVTAWNLNELIDGLQSFLMVIIEVGLMYLAINLWQHGVLTIGDFALIQAYLIILFGHLWDFGRLLRNIYEGLADATEMVEILETPHEIQDTKKANALAVKRGQIEFQNVTFGFHQTRKVLDRFNLIIEPNERVALVGSSGAGKSTITHLLYRLYDIDGGKILIDGQNIANVTQDSLRQAVALVPQEPILFHRTLLENIRYGRREATSAEVIEAAKQAHCHEFITELPLGYDTYVGERGIKLSGGERQRVAIARAILKNAPILVLDEATSSLDSESEALIQDALKQLMKDKTVIVIAHRLSTILSMDRIIVIENGKVIDMGTHQELLQRRGIYKKLWEIQAGGFLP